MTRKPATDDEPTPRKERQRAPSNAIATPPSVLKAARKVSGWAYGSSVTRQQPDGTLAIELRLAHRGGMVVDHTPFRAISSRYIVIHVYSHVERGTATVWLTLRPVM